MRTRAEAAESEEWDRTSVAACAEAVSRLDARSQDIVTRRWMTDEKATLHELAAKHGVSAERIRQIEVVAMNRLKTLMAEA